jgi:hypothetical protein
MGKRWSFGLQTIFEHCVAKGFRNTCYEKKTQAWRKRQILILGLENQIGSRVSGLKVDNNLLNGPLGLGGLRARYIVTASTF